MDFTAVAPAKGAWKEGVGYAGSEASLRSRHHRGSDLAAKCRGVPEDFRKLERPEARPNGRVPSPWLGSWALAIPREEVPIPERWDAFEVYAAWLSSGGPDRSGGIDELLRDHPGIGGDLETLHAAWARLADAGTNPAPRKSVHEDVVERFGEDADSRITLHGERSDGSRSASPSSRLSELAERTGSFGRYEVEDEIARGGMGAIFRVWDADLRRHLAMKVALGLLGRPPGAEPSTVQPRSLARFLEEAQVTGQLDHPGIVPVHELGLDDEGRVYFTMKLVEGRDLKQIFGLVFEDREGWNETRAVGVLQKACEALAYAHKKGVIHRDLKPANVMVGSFGEVFVMDWGLARVLGRKDAHDLRLAPEAHPGAGRVRSDRRDEIESGTDSPLLTIEGDVVGTPAYMPPEQARGEIESLSPRSDVYSIGAMLYHLLARDMPYASEGERVPHRAMLLRVITGPPKPLHEVNGRIPAELAAICEKAMARDAADRYPDTLALAEDLRAYLERRVVRAYETGAVAELRKWVARNRPLAAAIVVAFLLLVAGLTASLVFKSRAEEKAADLATANSTIQGKNTELTTARNAAEQKANDVLSLSAIQDLRDLEDRADALWPADPDHVPAYDAWLADARLLIDGRPADPASGVKRRPSLAEHEANLAEIRRRAKPLSPAQVEQDRLDSPSYAEWKKESERLRWFHRMLGDEPWPLENDVEAELAKETLPTDAKSLNEMAWRLVDTDIEKARYGGEVRGLLLARRALAVASDAERAGVRDTLARALWRCARFDEALAEQQRAIDEAEGKLKDDLSESLKKMRTQADRWIGEEARSMRRASADALASRVAGLEEDVVKRRTYEFDDGDDRWWHTQLATLVTTLGAFEDKASGGLLSAGTSKKHGWGILKRRESAETIEEHSVRGGDASSRWSEAAAAVAASPKYAGLKLTPQLGLLPIGPDPDSGLWEFAQLETGDPPERGSDGKLVLRDSMGLVLVLIPGGTFEMGAQRTDDAGPNYDPQARKNEGPVHEVELSPFFLSKYEMTQGQWERFAGSNPSAFETSRTIGRDPQSPLHPVERVSWAECRDLLSRLALTLPTEAQWEYACRAGSRTPWWTGADRETLRGKVNLADQTVKRAGAGWSEIDDWPDFDDGWAGHAPIGTFAANPFGLHEMHGNVWEWCADGYDERFYERSPRRDPVESAVGKETRIFRGGSFTNAAMHARSANRYEDSPNYKHFSVGLRPARELRKAP